MRSVDLAVSLAVLLAAGVLASAQGEEKAAWKWYDGTEVNLEGKGWTKPGATETHYDRLPVKGANDIPWSVWNLQKHTAGMSFRFVTDSSKLVIRWKPRFPSLAMYHMPATGVSGVDVYQQREDGSWRFVSPPYAPPKVEGSEGTWSIRSNALTVVNLPLYNGLESISFGVKPGCEIRNPPPRRSGVTKPVVFYGTSTTQGGCVTRPGHCWTTVATRLADVPQVNLGFSGAGKMEDVMLDRVAELDASVYVLDTVGNMGVDLLNARFEKFVRGLRARRPSVPIVVMAHPWDSCGDFPAQRAFVTNLVAKLRAEDSVRWRDLHFLGDESFLTGDNDDTVEGAHLNDLGAHRMGESCARLLKSILKL